MSIKQYKPTTAGRRGASSPDFSDLTKARPEKSLIIIKKRKAGRSGGKITVRHRGGEHKKYYRLVDFDRKKFNQPAKVLSIEYDPNRTARIALLQYQDGTKNYIIAPVDLKVGDEIMASLEKAEIKTGNCLPLDKIPIGLPIHNIELVPGSGSQIVRAGGSAAVIQAVEAGYAQVKLPSGEIRLIPQTAMATIGQVSNIDNINVRLGKAGRMRWLGVRPSVRGKAMNPVDHPHGGGEGHNPIGLTHPKTPWGKPALGVPTRKSGKRSDKFIIKRRK